jgi:integrase
MATPSEKKRILAPKRPKKDLSKKRVVDAVKPEVKRFMVWDSSVSGFGLDVFPTGKKSWILFYRVDGTQRRITLGSADRMPPAKALAAMHTAMGKVGQGTDPLLARRETSRAQQAPGDTLDDVAVRYLHTLGIVHTQRWTKEATRYYESFIKPALGQRRARDVAVRDVRALHEWMADKPVSANRMKAVLSAILSRAMEDDGRDEDLNPASRVRNYPEEERERYLLEAEWPRMANAIHLLREELLNVRDSDTRQYQLEAVILLALTGARVRAILPRRWSDFDEEDRSLKVIPAHKGVKKIILGRTAEVYLRGLQAQRGEESEFIFPSKPRRTGERTVRGQNDLRPPAPKTAISGLAPMWSRAANGMNLTELANIEDFTLHDWRRSFATVGGDVGVSAHMIGGLLDHKVKGVTRRYARRTDKSLWIAASDISKEVACRLELKINI